MKPTRLFLTVAAALCAMGCALEEVDTYVPEAVVTFSASFGSDDETKTSLGTSENGKPQSMWNDGDAITIHNGSKGYTFSTTLEESSAKADFSYGGHDFTAPDGVIAVYPNGSYTADLAGREVTVNIPSAQTAVAGSFDPAAGVGVAYSQTNSLKFKNVTGMIKFTLKTEGVKSVIFSGMGGEAIAGDAKVTLDESGAVTAVAAGSETVTSVELTAPGSEKLATDTPYYLAIAPQSFEKGFTVHVRYTDGGEMHLIKGYTKSYDIERNIILNIGALEAGELPTITALSFTAAANPGKILGKKLYYTSKTTGSWFWETTTYFTTYTDKEEETTQTMTVANNEFTGCIPYLNDRNLVPSMTYTEGATIGYSTDGGKSFIQWDGSSTINFAPNAIIRVSKGDLFNDYVCRITNTGLPVVVINQPNGDESWDETGEYVVSKATDFDTIEDGFPGTMAVYNADGTVNLSSATAMVRLRGNTTQEFPKKPFAIKLGKKAEVLGMPKHKRWVLLANWKDKSLMRNHVALGVAQKFTETFSDGIPWNVHGEFVEVVYNGVHVGNYYLCEQIKIDENRLNIKSEYDAGDYPTITEEDLNTFGYLMECDDYYDENTKFLTKHYIPFQFKDDGDEGGVILNYMKNKVQGIEDNLYNGFKNKNASSYEAAYADLDLPSVVDQLLIYEMTMNSEMGHPRSVYMYQNGTGKLCAGPVWDFDWLSFPIESSVNSNSCLDELNNGWDRSYTASLMATASHKNKHYVASSAPTKARTDDVPYVWYPMMITESTFQNLAAERWNAVKSALSAYAKEIRTTADQIAVSWEYNNAMWPAYYNDDCDRQDHCDGGYCGDERMTSFDEISDALYGAYMTRLNGMSFVTSKSWPTWTIN